MSSKNQGTTRKEFLTGTVAAAGIAGAATLGFTRPALADHHEKDERIIQIFRCKLDPEKTDEAVELLSTLVKAVEENEPGVLAYMANRTEDNDIVFFEIFRDQATLDAHGKQPHMSGFMGAFGSILLPPYTVEKLTSIGGFAR